MASTTDQQAYSIVLSLKIQLDLVNFCLICGTSLKEEDSSNLVTPLNHILSSPCFIKNNGSSGVKDIQLFQGGNEHQTEVSLADQSKPEKSSQKNKHVIEKEDWSDDDEDWREPFDDNFDGQDETEKKTKFINDLTLARFNCDKCDYYCHSRGGLWNHMKIHKQSVI
eukprot:GFUD01137502.1.p1 GENE.GFUD01137502.1~~GFUD01137502.1.p1  ORF type:complete len:167 (-),score=44.26 GFUD01137502.1:51-551(-)